MFTYFILLYFLKKIIFKIFWSAQFYYNPSKPPQDQSEQMKCLYCHSHVMALSTSSLTSFIAFLLAHHFLVLL